MNIWPILWCRLTGCLAVSLIWSFEFCHSFGLWILAFVIRIPKLLEFLHVLQYCNMFGCGSTAIGDLFPFLDTFNGGFDQFDRGFAGNVFGIARAVWR